MNNKQLEIYKKMTLPQRITAACGLHDFAVNKIYATLKLKYPEMEKKTLMKMMAKRFLNESARFL